MTTKFGKIGGDWGSSGLQPPKPKLTMSKRRNRRYGMFMVVPCFGSERAYPTPQEGTLGRQWEHAATNRPTPCSVRVPFPARFGGGIKQILSGQRGELAPVPRSADGNLSVLFLLLYKLGKLSGVARLTEGGRCYRFSLRVLEETNLSAASPDSSSVPCFLRCFLGFRGLPHFLRRPCHQTRSWAGPEALSPRGDGIYGPPGERSIGRYHPH